MAKTQSKYPKTEEFLHTGKVFVYSSLDSALKQAEESIRNPYGFTKAIENYLIDSITRIIKNPHRYDLPNDFDFTEFISIRKEISETLFWKTESNTANWVERAPKRLFFMGRKFINNLKRIRNKYEPVSSSESFPYFLRNKKKNKIIEALNYIIESFTKDFKGEKESAIESLDIVAQRTTNQYQDLTIVGDRVKNCGYFKQHIIHWGDVIGFKNKDSEEQGTYKGLTVNGKIKIEYDNKIILTDSENIFPVDKNDYCSLQFIEIDETLEDDYLKNALEINELTKEELSNKTDINNLAKQNKFVEGQVLFDYLGTLYFIKDRTETLDYYNNTPRLYKDTSFRANINGEETEVIYTGNISNKGIEVNLKDDKDNKLHIKLNDIILDSITRTGINYQLHEANSISYTLLKFSLEEFANAAILSNRYPDIGEVQLPYETLDEIA